MSDESTPRGRSGTPPRMGDAPPLSSDRLSLGGGTTPRMRCDEELMRRLVYPDQWYQDIPETEDSTARGDPIDESLSFQTDNSYFETEASTSFARFNISENETENNPEKFVNDEREKEKARSFSSSRSTSEDNPAILSLYKPPSDTDLYDASDERTTPPRDRNAPRELSIESNVESVSSQSSPHGACGIDSIDASSEGSSDDLHAKKYRLPSQSKKSPTKPKKLTKNGYLRLVLLPRVKDAEKTARRLTVSGNRSRSLSNPLATYTGGACGNTKEDNNAVNQMVRQYEQIDQGRRDNILLSPPPKPPALPAQARRFLRNISSNDSNVARHVQRFEQAMSELNRRRELVNRRIPVVASSQSSLPPLRLQRRRSSIDLLPDLPERRLSTEELNEYMTEERLFRESQPDDVDETYSNASTSIQAFGSISTQANTEFNNSIRTSTRRGWIADNRLLDTNRNYDDDTDAQQEPIEQDDRTDNRDYF